MTYPPLLGQVEEMYESNGNRPHFSKAHTFCGILVQENLRANE